MPPPLGPQPAADIDSLTAAFNADYEQEVSSNPQFFEQETGIFSGNQRAAVFRWAQDWAQKKGLRLSDEATNQALLGELEGQLFPEAMPAPGQDHTIGDTDSLAGSVVPALLGLFQSGVGVSQLQSALRGKLGAKPLTPEGEGLMSPEQMAGAAEPLIEAGREAFGYNPGMEIAGHGIGTGAMLAPLAASAEAAIPAAAPTAFRYGAEALLGLGEGAAGTQAAYIPPGVERPGAGQTAAGAALNTITRVVGYNRANAMRRKAATQMAAEAKSMPYGEAAKAAFPAEGDLTQLSRARLQELRKSIDDAYGAADMRAGFDQIPLMNTTTTVQALGGEGTTAIQKIIEVYAPANARKLEKLGSMMRPSPTQGIPSATAQETEQLRRILNDVSWKARKANDFQTLQQTRMLVDSIDQDLPASVRGLYQSARDLHSNTVGLLEDVDLRSGITPIESGGEGLASEKLAGRYVKATQKTTEGGRVMPLMEGGAEPVGPTLQRTLAGEALRKAKTPTGLDLDQAAAALSTLAKQTETSQGPRMINPIFTGTGKVGQTPLDDVVKGFQVMAEIEKLPPPFSVVDLIRGRATATSQGVSAGINVWGDVKSFFVDQDMAAKLLDDPVTIQALNALGRGQGDKMQWYNKLVQRVPVVAGAGTAGAEAGMTYENARNQRIQRQEF